MSRSWVLLPILWSAGAALADPPPVHRIDVERRADFVFDKCDVNHDGVLTLAEYHNAEATIIRVKGGPPPTPQRWAVLDAGFAAVDQTHSGRVTRAQFVDAALAHFDGADLNHDGIVMPDEARKAATIKRRVLKEQEKAARAAAQPGPATP